MEYLENEEKNRQERIRKAKRLEDSWKLSNLCREYIQQNSQVWQAREIQCKEEILEAEKMERKEGQVQGEADDDGQGQEDH